MANQFRLPPNFKLYKASPKFIWDSRLPEGGWPKIVFRDRAEEVTTLPQSLVDHALVYFTTDVDTGENTEIVFHFSTAPEKSEDSEEKFDVKDFLYKMMVKLLKHEILEWYTIDGKPYRNAHSENGKFNFD